MYPSRGSGLFNLDSPISSILTVSRFVVTEKCHNRSYRQCIFVRSCYKQSIGFCHCNLLLYSHALFCSEVHSTTRFHRLFSQLSAVRPTKQLLVGISPRGVLWPNLDSCTNCCVSYVRLEPVARVENRISTLSLSLSLLLSSQHECISVMQPSQLASQSLVRNAILQNTHCQLC